MAWLSKEAKEHNERVRVQASRKKGGVKGVGPPEDPYFAEFKSRYEAEQFIKKYGGRIL